MSATKQAQSATLLDYFRAEIMVQNSRDVFLTTPDAIFWKPFAEEWWTDWKERGVLFLLFPLMRRVR